MPTGNENASVRIVHSSGRTIQLRYFCRIERREVRLSTGTHGMAEAERQKAQLEAELRRGVTHPSRAR